MPPRSAALRRSRKGPPNKKLTATHVPRLKTLSRSEMAPLGQADSSASSFSSLEVLSVASLAARPVAMFSAMLTVHAVAVVTTSQLAAQAARPLTSSAPGGRPDVKSSTMYGTKIRPV